jgi:type 1 fimbria pilin
MKNKVLFMGTAALLVLLASALAADLTGKWVAQMEGGPMGPSEMTFNFKADGTP